MDKFITFYDKYTIWQLSEDSLHELAGFVVRENYRHHTNGRLNIHFETEVEAVYREEVRYFNHSRIFVAKNSENNIIGAIRLMLWDGRETLPIQSLFGIQCLNDISPDDSCSAIWHIGRLAVNTDIGRHGLLLFKSLLLYAMYPICNRKKGIVFAECDSKLLRTMKLMGIRVHSLGNGIEYLGSETIPVYSTYDDLVGFFRENQSSYGINQASVVAWNAIVRNNQVSLRRLFWIRIEKYSVKPDVFCPKEKEAVS